MGRKKNLDEFGFGLIEILVSVGILGIVMAALATIVTSHGKEVRHLEVRLAVLDLERVMITSLYDSSICTSALTNPSQSFDSTDSSSKIEISRIAFSSAPGAPDIVAVGASVFSGVTVQSISVKDIKTTGNPDEYNGTLLVTFLNANGRPLKPIDFLVSLKTDPDPVTSPATAKKIVSCNLSQQAGKVPAGSPCLGTFTDNLGGVVEGWVAYRNGQRLCCAPYGGAGGGSSDDGAGPGGTGAYNYLYCKRY